MDVVRKAVSAEVERVDDDAFEYVMSDASVDRIGDVVEQNWALEDFTRNPIALFGHRSDFPIGTWQNVRVEDGRLKGVLKLAAKGTSQRIDEVIALVKQGILKSVSVGFRPLAAQPLKKEGSSGVRFTKNTLVECSLVSIPANPNALQVARSLNVSRATMTAVFGENADKGTVRRELNGEHAETPPALKAGKMKTLIERIEDAQNEVVRLKDILTAEVAKDEPDQTIVDETTVQIEQKEGSLAGLQRAEAVLATKAVTVTPQPDDRGGVTVQGHRPFAVPAKKVAPADHVIRSLVSLVVGHVTKQHPNAVLAERYGEDGKIDEQTKIVHGVVTRAASAPADTTTSGWASQLVETSIAQFMELLMPQSVYPGLSARGLRLNFGRSGIISIPTRAATPTIAGSFVAQGAPIPVRQGAFSAVTLTPKKMAVISTFTREIAEHSTPAIEGLIRNAIQEDTSVAMDTILLDATAASTTRPAGLRNGVSVTTATAGGGFAALVGDVKGLVGALITASSGNLRSPVWVMNPVNALSASLTQNAGGDFPFAAELNANRLMGYPIILSSTVTAGMVILVDSADFVSVEGDAPRFDMSDQATLHMEDTTPLAIGTAGSPATVAAPVRSLFQTDSMALRMIMDVNWAMRRTGVLAWTQSITW